MKTTLIIFLFLISILIYIITFLKLKLSFEVSIQKNIATIKGKIFKKKIEHEIKFSLDNILYKPKEDIKILNSFNKDIPEILDLIEIKKLDISLKIGTPFIFATTFLTIFISSIIPIIYQKINNKNGKLSYKIEPNFKDFEISGEIKIDLNITILNIIWLIIYVQRNNKEKRRRKKYEQSSYRGFNEYSYE